MTDKLKKYIDNNYPNSKSDLYSIFIEKADKYVYKDRMIALITQHSWMFLTSFIKLRKYIITNDNIISLVHLGSRAFEEIAGEVVQTMSCILRKLNNRKYNSKYIRLVDYSGDSKKIELHNKKNEYIASYEKLKYTTDNIFAYWAEDSILNLFKNEKKIIEYANPKQGLATGNNDTFLRFWQEVNNEKVGYGIKNEEECAKRKIKWIPCNKGGSARKWYGNNFYVINWMNNGKEIKELPGSVIRNEQYYFKEGLTWSTISTNLLAMRYCSIGYIFETKGSMCFPIDRKNIYYLLGYFNTKLINYILNMVSPTLDFHEGPIGKLPIKVVNNKKVDKLVKSAIRLSKKDWDSFETSWDFKVHPLLKSLDMGSQYKLSSIFNMWETECEENFAQLKTNEEELNRIFIDIYGLQDELTPEVEDKDITIRKADRTRDIKSLISYAVGCMFGRYSIDAEGLIYAGGEFSDKWKVDSEQCKVKSYMDIPENDLGTIREYKSDENANLIDEEHKLKEEAQREEVWIDASFVPDKDNIIPITEDEYFEDDIVSRFIEFIKSVYGEENLEENLDYIADSIGRKTSESSRQAIRRYFIKDFYKDHLKIYQKRPIYWMFDSGKNDGFKCLIYMHRYNEQTVAKVRTDYLHTLQRKYEGEINRQQLIVDSGESTTKDKTVAKKKIDRINKQIEECREYDEVVAYLANEKICIDLDDGVKVNYAKFQNVKVINSKDKEVKMNLLAKI